MHNTTCSPVRRNDMTNAVNTAGQEETAFVIERQDLTIERLQSQRDGLHRLFSTVWTIRYVCLNNTMLSYPLQLQHSKWANLILSSCRQLLTEQSFQKEKTISTEADICFRQNVQQYSAEMTIHVRSADARQVTEQFYIHIISDSG